MLESAGIRRLGAASIDLAWVAAGRVDGFWEQDLDPWDVAAGLLMVRESGGFATDFAGGPDIYSSRTIVAGAEPIHRALLTILRREA
jgi:myo-inositol-1(or 4)-monophosphatase